jgi:DNA-binding winged helix-turn-helix (wHTH) protein
MVEVWNGRVVSDNSLTVAVSRLRKLLGDRGMPRAGILTAHGHGYRFTRKGSLRGREVEPATAVEPHDAEFVALAEVSEAEIAYHVRSARPKGEWSSCPSTALSTTIIPARLLCTDR